MILKRLNINRLPGIDSPFHIELNGSGLHIVHGPNGIGKSSLCKALAGLYWSSPEPESPASVTARIEIEGSEWRAEREGTSLSWSEVKGNGSAPPPFPPAHQSRCFFLQLRDLIDPSRDGTTDLAAHINRQMSGGFDLDAVSETFAQLSAHRKRTLGRTFSEACQGIDFEEKKQSSLQSRVDQRQSLQDRLDAARIKARRKPSIERALSMIERKTVLDRLQAELDTYPPEMAKLTGDEEDRIHALQEKSRNYSERIRELQATLASASEARKKTGLSTPLDAPVLLERKSMADELVRLETSIDTSRADLSASEAALAAAWDAIGGIANPDSNLNLNNQSHLFEFLEKCERVRNENDLIRSKLRLLETEATHDGREKKADRLEAALSALRMWLRAPAQPPSSPTGSRKLQWLIGGIVAVLLGALLSAAVHPLFLLLAGAGIGLLVPAALSMRTAAHRTVASESREEARAAYELTDLDGPDQWDIASVKARLARLEKQFSKLGAAIELSRMHAAERQRLEVELEAVAERECKLGMERQELAGQLGLEDIPDVELVTGARALDRLHDARVQHKTAAGRLNGLLKAHAERLEQLASFLAEHGETAPRSAAEAKARIDALAERSTRIGRVLSEERSAREQIERTETEQNEIAESLRRIFLELSIDEGNLQALSELLNRRERYRAIRREILELQSQIDLVLRELASCGESALANLTAGQLEALETESSDSQDEIENLSSELGQIDALTKEARDGESMRELITVREDARDRLREGREEDLQSRAGRFLINLVKNQYEQTRMPRMLERAKSHFNRFTRHAYDLRLGRRDGSPALQAIECQSGMVRELDELSDGTRVQLLLAARLAFAEELEQGTMLPLILDEALDQSDPRRFEAIVRSLGRIAADQNRQIVYLTSDPVDIERIRAALDQEDLKIASTVDLGRIRKVASSVGDPGMLPVHSPPDVPAPGNESFEEYGARLHVPEFRPARGWETQHLFYVLPGETGMLHEFVRCGIECAGQWGLVADKPLAEKLCRPILTPDEVGNRLELLRTFCGLWQLGRGHPVDRIALEESGAVTDRYLDGVSEMARELKGDARALLESLEQRRDERTRGFQSKQVERLEQYLLDSGYIDERPILGDQDLLLRGTSSPAADSLPGNTARELLQRWLAWAARFSESASPGGG